MKKLIVSGIMMLFGVAGMVFAQNNMLLVFASLVWTLSCGMMVLTSLFEIEG